LSKLSKLKQEAFLAAKKRDWDSAVSFYERILELDKNNPTLINELGDICLKKGELNKAVTHFLAAASKYRATGLQNNAVAIYKKILRHEPENLNAHWFLAEIRAGQGLTVEGEKHALSFLTSSENISAELKDIFLKRCMQLFGLYPSSTDILERLQGVFRLWSMPLEEARVSCLLAALCFEGGQHEEAELNVQAALEKVPEVANYPEYVAWRKTVDPNADITNQADVNSLNLVDPAGGGQPSSDFVNFNLGEPESPTAKSGDSADETSFADVQVGIDADDPGTVPTPAQPAASFDDLMSGVGSPEQATTGQATTSPSVQTTASPKDNAGRIEIDVNSSSSFEDLLNEAESSVKSRGKPTSENDTNGSAPGDIFDSDQEGSQKVDLLAEILAEEGADLASGAAEQIDTIASEIGQQVGGEGSPDDAGRQYEMGVVYLEMGLFDQACESFNTAALNAEYALRSFEMWGVALRRLERVDEAIEVLARGLAITVTDPQEQLGLIYHTGRAHEQSDRIDEAREWYERAHAISPSFRDVQQRLASLPLA